jgi:hypothetical protein
VLSLTHEASDPAYNSGCGMGPTKYDLGLAMVRIPYTLH